MRRTGAAPLAAAAPSLGVLESRGALPQERRDAFPEVARAAGERLVAVFHRDRLLERAGVDRVLEAFLGEAQAEAPWPMKAAFIRAPCPAAHEKLFRLAV